MVSLAFNPALMGQGRWIFKFEPDCSSKQADPVGKNPEALAIWGCDA